MKKILTTLCVLALAVFAVQANTTNDLTSGSFGSYSGNDRSRQYTPTLKVDFTAHPLATTDVAKVIMVNSNAWVRFLTVDVIATNNDGNTLSIGTVASPAAYGTVALTTVGTTELDIATTAGWVASQTYIVLKAVDKVTNGVIRIQPFVIDFLR